MRTGSRLPKVGGTDSETIINVNEGDYVIYNINDTHIGLNGDLTLINAVEDFVTAVNRDKPDLAIHLGDVWDTTDESELFLEKWTAIQETKTWVTAGNHEFDTFPTDSEVAKYFSHQGKTVNGGSRFNQTFVLDRYDLKVRIVFVDSVFNASDERTKTYRLCQFHSETIPWFESVINEADEDVILVFTHALPHYYEFDYFASQSQAEAVRDIVDAKKVENPNLNLHWFGGHMHIQNIVNYNNLGANNPGHRLPTSLENANGRMTIIKVDKDGVVSMQKQELPYQT